MAITELATLQLKEGKAWEDILPHIRTLSHEQASISGFPLFFFDDAHTDNPGTIYLLSGWIDVSAHEQWIASDTNQRLLRDLKPLLDVKNLLHLTIEPSPEMWKQACAVVFFQSGLEKVPNELNVGREGAVLWDDTGVDAEKKVESGFRLVVLNAEETSFVSSSEEEADSELHVCTMHPHNIL